MSNQCQRPTMCFLVISLICLYLTASALWTMNDFVDARWSINTYSTFKLGGMLQNNICIINIVGFSHCRAVREIVYARQSIQRKQTSSSEVCFKLAFQSYKNDCSRYTSIHENCKCCWSINLYRTSRSKTWFSISNSLLANEFWKGLLSYSPTSLAQQARDMGTRAGEQWAMRHGLELIE